jgi:hypothetical protein
VVESFSTEFTEPLFGVPELGEKLQLEAAGSSEHFSETDWL